MLYDVKIKKLPKSEAELEVSLPAEFLVNARKKAISIFSASLELSGFRKGHIPENIVIEKIGEGRLLEEAADILLKEHFPKIIAQEKLDIIGQPKIAVTKLAPDNPAEFKASVALMPEFELPEYKKIAKAAQDKSDKEQEKTEATEKEVEDILLQIRKNKAHLDWHKAHPEETGHDHPEIKDEDLPELNDQLAQEAGNFKNLSELKDKIKENIVTEKKTRNTEKKRAMIIEDLLKAVKIDLPEILIESENQKALAQMKDDIARMGGKWEDYLAHTKRSEDDLKKDLRESSEKKAKIQLIFNKIAAAEDLHPNKEIMEHEIAELKKHYPEASETNIRIYVATLLLNQEVLKILEG